MADSFDKQLEVADVYADALFALAREAGKVEEVRSELDELVKLSEMGIGFSGFLSSRALDDDHRAAGLEKMFRGKLSDVVLNTLLVMNDNGRSGLFGALHHAYILRQQAAANQVDAFVTSAVALDDAQKKAVTDTAAQVSGKTPIVHYDVDPSILGGLIVTIGDWRYDNSVSRKLGVVRRRLLERAERGLPVGMAE